MQLYFMVLAGSMQCSWRKIRWFNRTASSMSRKTSHQNPNNPILKTWLRRRQSTFILGCVSVFLYGFEKTSVAISALYYFRDDFPTTDGNANVFYGMAQSALYISAMFSEPCVGKYIDRTRNLRGVVCLATFINITGSLVYTINISSWLPVVGRLICGISEPVFTSFIGIYFPHYYVFFWNASTLSCN